MTVSQRTIVVGTRGSALALAQTHEVVAAVEARWPDIDVRIERIRTAGDRDRASSLRQIGGQGVFVKEIERALWAGEIDLAVHSLKDVPATVPPDLALVAHMPREDPRDALVSRSGAGLLDLPSGATVGTGSRRRRAQLRAVRSDLVVRDLRGNVDTRLRKVNDGSYDAVVLAVAGLRRIGRADAITEILSPEIMLPAPGQGTIVVQARADDEETIGRVSALDDPDTRAAVTAERAFLRVLGAGCRVPVGGYATVHGGSLHMRGLIGDEDSGRLIRGETRGSVDEGQGLGRDLARRLLSAGGARLLGREEPCLDA